MMGKHFLLAALAGVAIMPAGAANPKQQPPGTPKSSGQATVSADTLHSGRFTGTIVSPPDAERMLTLKIDYQNVQINQQALRSLKGTLQREYQQVHRLQQQLQREMMQPNRQNQIAGTVRQLQQAIARLQITEARGGQNIYKTTPASANVSFQLEQEVKVRTTLLPEEFDDKGNIKKYSQAELNELKGNDRSLPGYQSSLEQLQAGCMVQVVQAAHQQPRRPVTAPPKNAKDAPEPATEDGKDSAVHEHKMQVKMVLILDDGTGRGLPNKKR
jgi:hypothetical protein